MKLTRTRRPAGIVAGIAALALLLPLVRTANHATAQDAPPPAASAPAAAIAVTVSADQAFYHPGDPITATITNSSDVMIWGNGGYACGLVHVELGLSGPPGWAPAPGGAEVCALIAQGVGPGETRTETLTLDGPGLYRLVVRATTDAGAPVEAYSEPFLVDFQEPAP